MKQGYKYKPNKILQIGTFETIISQQKQFYLIRVNVDGKQIEFRDSYKKLPFTVAKIAKDFLHDEFIQKGEIDYKKLRLPNDELSEEDKEYIKLDIIIVAHALEYLMNNKQTSLTTGADALKLFKALYGKNFEKWFPVIDIEIDSKIRKSYKGGYTYIRKGYEGIEFNEQGNVYDVNSLYPDRMVNCSYPVQEPLYFTGMYEYDKYYPLYFIHFEAMFVVKENRLPTLQIKKNRFFISNDFVEDSCGMVELTMTSVDFELFQEHYEILEIHYIDGFKFRCASGIFDDYILPMYEKRQQCMGAEKALYKLLLNALYGKFAKNPDTSMIEPTLENDCVSLRTIHPEISNPLYLPVGSFITAYARQKTITTAQKMYNQFIYADTDSLHIKGIAPDWLEIDSKKLGAWKHENSWNKAKFLRPKRYIEIGENETIIKCCGLSDKAKENVTWENFIKGQAYVGNLKSKTVSGGIVLVDNGFILD